MHLVFTVFCLSLVAMQAASLETRGGLLRVEVTKTDTGTAESIRIKSGGAWILALSARGSATRVITADNPGKPTICKISAVSEKPSVILTRAECDAGTLERRISATSEPDVVDVSVRFVPKLGARIHSVEDRYEFAPARRSSDLPTSGPLDFVWSQNIKSQADDVVANEEFKSPAVILQQGSVFSALLANVGAGKLPLAFDLDVTSGERPWFSYGVVVSKPYGHSYFRRSPDGLLPADGAIDYRYSIVASAQPKGLGYRRVVRRLWSQLGRRQLLDSVDLQKNVKKPELELFDDWRQDAWHRYADEVYREFDCGGRKCGTLMSMRNVWGDWKNGAPDAWFNSWFQTLRTAYGWRLYGQRTGNAEILHKSENILNLALKSPRKEGAFSTIYLLNEDRWIPEDGWAGFPDDYHAFCMSWTAYWMLRWGRDLTPERKDEILTFVRPYGDFLLRSQLPNGVIPSWYRADLTPRPEFREFNAETAGSALLLLELAGQTGEQKYADTAIRAMDFVTREVLPRQRWSDFETFKSCAGKDFDFYDRWTAQYPQNNLSTIQAAMAYMQLFRSTREPRYLDLGTRVLDYLLLTQQMWNPPAFTPKLVGGFTTQNTDAEWSDARQGYAAVLLWDSYGETGESEYLERAVAAARSTFAVAPWENWAHTGYEDKPGALTGIHWGTGSAMTSVEIMALSLGDAFIDVKRKHGVGFNACSLRDVKIDGGSIRFRLEASPRMRTVKVKFAGIDTRTTYRIAWNDQPAEAVSGELLARDGYVIRR